MFSKFDARRYGFEQQGEDGRGGGEEGILVLLRRIVPRLDNVWHEQCLFVIFIEGLLRIEVAFQAGEVIWNDALIGGVEDGFEEQLKLLDACDVFLSSLLPYILWGTHPRAID